MRTHLTRLLGILTIIGGSMALAGTGQQALAADGCTFCINQCPPDLEAYCGQRGCVAEEGTSCTLANCQGESGTWYDYRIECVA